MSIQSMYLLHLLKKAQVKEDFTVTVLPSQISAGIITHGEQKRTTPIVKFPWLKNSLSSTLLFLRDIGYIELKSTSWGSEKAFEVSVTHKGWHNWQTEFGKIMDFLFRSVAVPIAVAFLTAVITSIITVNAV